MVTGIMSCNVYVDDFEAAERFYGEVLGLKRGREMGPQSCFFHVGGNEYGLYVEGGCEKTRAPASGTRTSFSIRVDSAQALFDRLAAAGTELLDEAPCDMGRGYSWFRFRDPTGNILEAISGPAGREPKQEPGAQAPDSAGVSD